MDKEKFLQLATEEGYSQQEIDSYLESGQESSETGQDRELLSKVTSKPDETLDFLTGKTTTPPSTFLTRLALGFGGPEAKALQQRIEEATGKKGRVDIGDIADIGGAALPVIGSFIGGLGGVPGAALGAGVGEAGKKFIGSQLGVSEDTISETGSDVVKTVAGTYIGGKVLGWAFDKVFKVIPEKFISTIFKQSADDIVLEAKSGGMNPTQAQEVLEEGFRGNAKKMMTYAFNTVKDLDKQAHETVAGKTVEITNKKGYINILLQYAKNIKKVSYGFEGNLTKKAIELSNQLKQIKGDVIPGELALEVRRFIDAIRSTNSFRANPKLSPSQEGFKKAADSLRKQLADQIPGFSSIMNRFQIHLNAIKDLGKYAAQAQNKDLFDLVDVFIMYGIDPTAYLGRRFLSSGAFKTNVAQGLYKGGKFLEKVLPIGVLPTAITEKFK